MKKQNKLKNPTFNLRLWTEQQKERGEIKRWRGIIKHKQSNETRHFNGVGQLLTFIEQKSGMKSSIYKERKKSKN